MRKLAEHTATQTREIRTLTDAVAAQLDPARIALARSLELVEGADQVTAELAGVLRETSVLASEAAQAIDAIASAVQQQTAALESATRALEQATGSVGAIERETRHVAEETFVLSQGTQAAYEHLAKVDTGTTFHRALALCRELAERCQRVFERAIDEGRVRLEDVLELRYTEIKGPAIRSLARLFDVSRVPPEGFSHQSTRLPMTQWWILRFLRRWRRCCEKSRDLSSRCRSISTPMRRCITGRFARTGPAYQSVILWETVLSDSSGINEYSFGEHGSGSGQLRSASPTWPRDSSFSRLGAIFANHRANANSSSSRPMLAIRAR